MKIKIQREDQFRNFYHYQTVHHLPTARRIAQERSTKLGVRHRLVDEDGTLLDLFFP